MKQLVNLFRKSRGQKTAQRPRLKTSKRRLTSESLEKRQLLAGDLLAAHNYAVAEDVNGDFSITPLDALIVINHMSRNGGSHDLSSVARGDLPNYLDVSGDNQVTPIDALRVINRISRGEAVGELVELRVNPRTINDEAFGSEFNEATRELNVQVDQPFNLEIQYLDLRTGFGEETGVFAIFTDIFVSQPNFLEPVLTETQRLSFAGDLSAGTTGTVTFSFEGTPQTNTVIDYATFRTNPRAQIGNALVSLGYAASEVSVTQLPGGSANVNDPFIFEIRFLDLDLADQNLPNLNVVVNANNAGGQSVPITVTTTDRAPRNPDGTINPAAVADNINFRSRTFNNNQTFFGFNGLIDGTFSSSTGAFSNVGGVGPTGSIPSGGGTLIEPFDAFSIPVRIRQAVTNLTVTLDPPAPGSTSILLYDVDDPIPDDLIEINTTNDPTIATDGFGLLRINAGAVTVSAGDSALNATEDTTATINLGPLTSVSGSSDAPVFTVTTQPARGSVSITGTTATFAPADNDFTVAGSPLTFVYTATVGSVSDTGTITVNVANVNDAPVAVADASVAAVQGVALTIPISTLLSNDLPGPANGAGIAEPGTVSLAATPAPTATNGTLSVSGDNFIYTAAVGFTGPATISYTITDGALTAPATLTVNVTAPSPVTVTAGDTTLDATEDTDAPLNLSSLTSVTGSSETPVFTITTQPARGTVSITGSTATFVPAENDFTVAGSPLTFVYTATVGSVSDTGTVTVNIANVNDPPVAVVDTAVSAVQGVPLTIVGSTLLANDRPGPTNGAGVPEPGSVSIATSSVPTATTGTVTLSDGNLIYTAPTDFTGSATIRYTITDGSLTAPASLVVNVASGAITVTANDSSLAAVEDTNATLNLGSLTSVTGSTTAPVFTITTQPARGNVTISGTTATYVPVANDFTVAGSPLTFVYTATVGSVSDTGTITVNIANVNDAPQFVADPATSTTRGVPLTIAISSLLSNDRPGPPNAAGVAEPGTVSLATSPAPSATNGSVVVSGGNFVFTPAANFTGAASISYTITDGSLSAPASLTVNVNAPTVVTVAAADSALSFVEDGPAQTLDLSTLTTVTGSSSAPTFAIVTQPARGMLNLVGSTVTYTPAANDFTTAPLTFVYRATVGSVSDTGTISISISSVNDAPVVVDDTLVISPGSGTVTFAASAVTANDRPGPANETGTVTLTAVAAIAGANPTRGTVALVGGSIVYTPPANFQGVDRFNYTVSDGSLTTTGVVTVAVAAPSSVSGVIFTDFLQNVSNPVRNGVLDDNEMTMAGMPVRLTSSATANLSGQAVNISVVSDAEGEYTFTDLLPGTYTVTFDIPDFVIPGELVPNSSTTILSPNSFQFVVSPTGGQAITGNSFTTLGFTRDASDTDSLDFLVSRYMRNNSGSANAGTALLVLDELNDETEIFQLGKGYDDVSFLEFAMNSERDAALLTILFENGSVESRLLGADEFAFNSNERVIRLMGSAASIGTPVGDTSTLASEFGDYRDAIDEILANGGV